MPAFVCELAWLGGERVEADVVVSIDGDRITAVEPGGDAPDGARRLAGLTLPGFANGHSHAFHRALRGRTHQGAGTFWAWREQMYRLAADLDPDRYLQLARATYAEMALAGIATVGEFHYLHHGPGGTPYDEPNVMADVLVQAASDVGVRLTLLDTCYLQGGIGQAPDELQRRFSDGDVEGWATRAGALRDGPAVRIGAAIHSVRAVDARAMTVVASWAEQRDAPLHAHVSEQPAENEQCAAAYGASPTQVLARAGALGPRFTAVHATHVTAADIELLGGSACSCCFCPTTERDLADGIGPARALDGAGARLVLGSDSHAVIDLLEEARAVELDERLATGVRGGHAPASLLAMATTQGHSSLGWPDAGRIGVGALADLTTVRLDSVRTAGARSGDALATVVFAATAADIHHVVIGGRVVVRDGDHVDLDVARELAAALAR